MFKHLLAATIAVFATIYTQSPASAPALPFPVGEMQGFLGVKGYGEFDAAIGRPAGIRG